MLCSLPRPDQSREGMAVTDPDWQHGTRSTKRSASQVERICLGAKRGSRAEPCGSWRPTFMAGQSVACTTGIYCAGRYSCPKDSARVVSSLGISTILWNARLARKGRVTAVGNATAAQQQLKGASAERSQPRPRAQRRPKAPASHHAGAYAPPRQQARHFGTPLRNLAPSAPST